MKKTLFICTGNICRSPTAEAIARHKAKTLKLENKFIFDSAATSSYHQGEPADARSVRVGESKGISFNNIFSRQITNKDFENFDLLMCMDRSHLSHLLKISDKKHHHKIHLFLQYCGVNNNWDDEVIDPYYSENKGFEEVYNIIDKALDAFFMEN